MWQHEKQQPEARLRLVGSGTLPSGRGHAHVGTAGCSSLECLSPWGPPISQAGTPKACLQFIR